MAITITVEDGSVVSGANSFISLNDFKSYLDNQGRVYSGLFDDEKLKAALVIAGQFLNNQGWKGVKTARENPMSWPRYGTSPDGWNQLEQPASAWLGVVDRNGFFIPTDSVPGEVIQAQCEGAWLILQGYALEPILERGGGIKRRKVDVVEIEYFEAASSQTIFRTIINPLTGLLDTQASGRLVRA